MILGWKFVVNHLMILIYGYKIFTEIPITDCNQRGYLLSLVMRSSIDPGTVLCEIFTGTKIPNIRETTFHRGRGVGSSTA